MDNVEAPPMASTSSSFFTPLCISLMGILFTSLVLLTYHLMVRSYHRRQAIAAAALLRPAPEAGSVTGIDGNVLETIPIIPYSSEEKCGVFRLDQSECAVCIGELEEGEMVRVLPNCKHGFHVVCIDQWFMGHSSCPICRSPLVPLPSECVDEISIRVEVSPDQNDDHNHTRNENSAGNTRRPCALLRHCVSLVLPMEKKQRRLLTGLKRSLSEDQTRVIIDVDRDCARDSSSSSSSSSASRENLTRSKSITSHFDSVSLKIWKSCSRLSVSRQSSTSGVLPY